MGIPTDQNALLRQKEFSVAYAPFPSMSNYWSEFQRCLHNRLAAPHPSVSVAPGVTIEPAPPVTIEALQSKLAEQSATIARLEAEVARLTPKKCESDAFPAAALSPRKRQIGLRTNHDGN